MNAYIIPQTRHDNKTNISIKHINDQTNKFKETMYCFLFLIVE